MCNCLKFCSAGLIVFSVACGSNNKTDDDTGYGYPSGGVSPVYVSGGGAGNTSGAGNIGGVGNTSGAGDVGGRDNTAGVGATGGRRMPILGTGGTTVVGSSVCDAPNVCGTVIDANEDVVECGFKNCPQEVCGLNAPNECPAACSTKITCASDDCGYISDGCGGVIDCGYTSCPQEVCGRKSPSKCPAECKTKPTCSSTDCGLMPDGCGGIIDCGYTNCPQEVCGQTAPNQCPPECKAKIDCKSAGNKDCGIISDGCGGLVDCGSTNCPADLCGVYVPNQCPAACSAKIDCKSAGNKDCGIISDGCGGIIDCGTCTPPQCCGCGSTLSAAVPNKCGGGTDAKSGSGLSQTCLAGSKGCLCDTMGGCAPGLLCNKTTTPPVCCNSTDSKDCHLPANTQVGATCAGTGQVGGCTPGITIPSASGSNDNCGYPATSFKESSIICGIVASGGGPTPAQIQAYFSDENDMTLGCNQNGYTVTALTSSPGYAYYPSTGDPTCVDSVNRPMRPSLYITDITNDPNCRAGDQQQGGQPYDPVAIFGSWKGATNGTPDANPDPFNYWNLSAAADPVPASVLAQCPCQPPPAGTPIPSSANSAGGNVTSANNCPGSPHQEKGFGTEVRYEAALLGGHSYRLQVIGHDGDQTQGGDAGEACVIFCAEGDTACVPTKCAPDMCGPQSDSCGGTIDCPCVCVPQGCPPDTCGKVGDGCGGTLDCGPCCVTRTCPPDVCGKVPDGCGGIIDCPCVCVPQTCPVGMCGKYPDGCGGIIDCPCECVPWTCEDLCPPLTTGSGNIKECSSINDGQVYVIDCPKPDGCYSVVPCYCPIG